MTSSVITPFYGWRSRRTGKIS